MAVRHLSRSVDLLEHRDLLEAEQLVRVEPARHHAVQVLLRHAEKLRVLRHPHILLLHPLLVEPRHFERAVQFGRHVLEYKMRRENL